MTSNLKKNLPNILFVSLFIIFGIIIFWRCRYGCASLDESFYLIFPYRFLQGDRFIVDEWNNTQLASVFLMPIMYVYMKIVGNTDGIFLFMRYLYTVFNVLISIFIYLKLKKMNKYGAMVSSLFFLIYCPYNIMALSYNTIAIGAFICSLFFLYTDQNNKYSFLSYIISGILLSWSVICNPYDAIIYIIYLIIFIVAKLKNHHFNNEVLKIMFSDKAFKGIFIGILLMAIVFLSVILHNNSISDIIKSIPYIVLGDAEHPVKVWWKIIPSFIVRCISRNDKHIPTLMMFMLLGLEILIYHFQKNKNDLLKTLIIITNIIMILSYAIIDGYINFIPYAIVVFSISLLIINENINSDMLYILIIPGILFCFCSFIASNTGFYVISAFSIVSAIGSIVVIIEIIEKSKFNYNKCLVIIYIILSFVFLMLFRINFVFGSDGQIAEQKTLITEGISRDLIVENESASKYYQTLEDTKDIRNDDGNLIVIGNDNTWIYLCSKMRNVSYSAMGGSDFNKIKYYESLHGKTDVDYIYIECDSIDNQVLNKLSDYYNLTVNKLKSGYVLD